MGSDDVRNQLPAANACCWIGELKGSSTGCTPNFVPGNTHFKTKVCPACQETTIRVPASRVRALTPSLYLKFPNSITAGFWTRAPEELGGGKYRLANNTQTCHGPRLLI